VPPQPALRDRALDGPSFMIRRQPSLLVTNPKLSMMIDNTERSNRGGAGGIIGDFLSTGKELVGKEAEIGESPRTRAESRPRATDSVRHPDLYILIYTASAGNRGDTRRPATSTVGTVR